MTLALRPDQIDVLKELRASRPEIRVVMIGATALLHHVPIDRETKDVDLVLAVELDELAPVLEPLSWRRHAHQLQRWIHRNGVIADVLPASPSLIAKSKVVFAEGFEMSLVGFDLLLTTSLKMELANTGLSIELASLPALVLLKTVAWLDRPDRVKDLSDLSRILIFALAQDDDRRFDPSGELFEIEFHEQPAFFVGSELRRLASNEHMKVLERFLAKLRHPSGTAFLQMLHASPLVGEDREDALWRVVDAFEKALTAKTPK